MWQLLVNGNRLEVGDKLRYRILSREIEIINESEICYVGEHYFWVVTTKYSDEFISEVNQQMIKYAISNLNGLGFEKWIEVNHI